MDFLFTSCGLPVYFLWTSCLLPVSMRHFLERSWFSSCSRREVIPASERLVKACFFQNQRVDARKLWQHFGFRGYVSASAAPGCSRWLAGTPAGCRRHTDPSPPALPDSPLQQTEDKHSEETTYPSSFHLFPHFPRKRFTSETAFSSAAARGRQRQKKVQSSNVLLTLKKKSLSVFRAVCGATS